MGVTLRRAINSGGVAIEEIGHDDEVSICGELVGNELGVDETMANGISEYEGLRSLYSCLRDKWNMFRLCCTKSLFTILGAVACVA